MTEHRRTLAAFSSVVALSSASWRASWVFSWHRQTISVSRFPAVWPSRSCLVRSRSGSEIASSAGSGTFRGCGHEAVVA